MVGDMRARERALTLFSLVSALGAFGPKATPLALCKATRGAFREIVALSRGSPETERHQASGACVPVRGGAAGPAAAQASASAFYA